MNKEFIPYQQALELKELGFDEPCFGWYDGKYTSSINQDYCKNSEEWLNTIHCAAPLYQQAFRWFREKYNIDAWVQPFTVIKLNGEIYLPDESYSYFIFKDGSYIHDAVDFLEPEEAELTCLIKLIEIAK